jgi:hypothetical protein
MGSGITKHCAIDSNCFSCKNDTNKTRKIWFIPLSFKSFSSHDFIHIHPPGIRGTYKKPLWKKHD